MIRQLSNEQFDIDFNKHWAEDGANKRVTTMRNIWGVSADIDAYCEVIKANINLGNTARTVIEGQIEEKEEELF